ncbi:phosphoribosylanthranilate isomerase [Sulfurihydrogenibium sp.]|uniref:phosphoribosylanthranilate isomerase n=1 Tax=Sulfurihydrogenibium sp. TaxID=2053621 RepID=UPI0026310594|nr:phosphoribosylanthranilate isomerase [Sulfurihydrogenibium sp.]
MIIKICGITLPQQAGEICSIGADFIGAIFYPKSPRYVNIDTLKTLKKSLNKNCKLVGVVVNPEEDTVYEILNTVDYVQFHGDEDYNFIKKFDKNKVIKVFRVKQESQIKDMEKYMEDGYLILVDTYKEGLYGGTGESINLELVKKIVNLYSKVIVSGGLGPDNIKKLLDFVKPYGVDASSKLEIKPGLKDTNKVKEFIKIVRSYESDN